MFDLIKFELKRIKSSPLFYIILGLSVGVGIISGAIGAVYQSSLMEFIMVDQISKDKLALLSTWIALSSFYNIFPIMGALYVTLFVGNDMSSGFLRNKMIAGHKRSDIYFSYIITQTALALVEVIISSLFALLVLAITRTSIDFDGGKMLVRLLVPVFAYISLIFLYTAFTLAVRKRALPIVICAVFAFSISSFALFATFGNYSQSELNKYLAIGPRMKADVSSYLKENAASQNSFVDVEDGEEYVYEELDTIDLYFDELFVPNKPFYYTMRVLYLVTDAGLSSDYGMTLFSANYNEELTTSLASYVKMEKDFILNFEGVDEMAPKVEGYVNELNGVVTEVPYKTLDAEYLIKTLAWSLVWVGGGYLIFRKKNIF